MSEDHGQDHPMCRQCWMERNPGVTPYRDSVERWQNERCCWCYTPTTAGIRVTGEAPQFCADVRQDSRQAGAAGR